MQSIAAVYTALAMPKTMAPKAHYEKPRPQLPTFQASWGIAIAMPQGHNMYLIEWYLTYVPVYVIYSHALSVIFNLHFSATYACSLHRDKVHRVGYATLG